MRVNSPDTPQALFISLAETHHDMGIARMKTDIDIPEAHWTFVGQPIATAAYVTNQKKQKRPGNDVPLWVPKNNEDRINAVTGLPLDRRSRKRLVRAEARMKVLDQTDSHHQDVFSGQDDMLTVSNIDQWIEYTEERRVPEEESHRDVDSYRSTKPRGTDMLTVRHASRDGSLDTRRSPVNRPEQPFTPTENTDPTNTLDEQGSMTLVTTPLAPRCRRRTSRNGRHIKSVVPKEVGEVGAVTQVMASSSSTPREDVYFNGKRDPRSLTTSSLSEPTFPLQVCAIDPGRETIRTQVERRSPDELPTTTYDGAPIPFVVDVGINDSKHRKREYFGKNALGFPTSRRVDDYRRDMSTVSNVEISEWIRRQPPEFAVATMANEEQQLGIHCLLFTWRDLFVEALHDMPATDLIVHDIPTVPNAKPIKTKVPLWTTAETEFQREKLPPLMKSGVLAQCRSDWSTKPKYVQKKDGDPKNLRMVNTFIVLNKYTIKCSYPGRRLEPILESIGQDKLKVFFQVDAANGYYAVPLNPDDAYKTAFPTIYGSLCYLRMGQGLTGASGTYLKLKDTVFGHIPDGKGGFEPPLGEADTDVSCHFYMDDDIGGATDVDRLAAFLHEHYFPRLAWAKLTLSPKKCRFFTDMLTVLGWEISGLGRQPVQSKRDVIGNWPVPKNEQELLQFTYMLPYLQDLIPGKADLINIMKRAIKTERRMEEDKDGKRHRVVKALGFEWDADCQKAFDLARTAIRDHIVSGGDPSLQYHLATDASGTGAGGVLVQIPGAPPGTNMFDRPMSEHRVIKFISKKFIDAQTRYHNTEREFLSLLLCLDEVRYLISGSPFPTMVYTDHSAILNILSNADNGRGRISRWQYEIGEYNLELHHIPGKKMVVADGLSRLREFPEMATIPRADDMVSFNIETESPVVNPQWSLWEEDHWYGPIVRYLLRGSLSPAEVVNGRTLSTAEIKRVKRKSVRYQLVETPTECRLYFVERNSKLSKCVRPNEVTSALGELHDTHGHFSAEISQRRSYGTYYWPTRHADIMRWCRSCHACQMVGPLRPSAGMLPILQVQPLDLIGLDYMGPLSPIAKDGSRFVLIIVDYFTRKLWATPTPNATSETTWAVFQTRVSDHYGFPLATYTDNGSHFTGKIFPQQMTRNAVKMHFAAPGAPSSVGMSEAYVKLVKTSLQKELQRNGTDITDWSILVPTVEKNINSRLVGSSPWSPDELFFGFVPRFPGNELRFEDVVRSTSQSLVVASGLEPSVSDGQRDSRLAKLDEIRDVSSNLRAHEQKVRADRDVKEWKTLREGDLVVLRRYRLDTQKSKKLEPRWSGPYLLSKLSYHGRSGHLTSLHTNAYLGRHHVNQLKKFVPRPEVDWMKDAVEGQRQEQEWSIIEERLDLNPEEDATSADRPREKMGDAFLRWIFAGQIRDTEERDPSYWYRRSVNLRA